MEFCTFAIGLVVDAEIDAPWAGDGIDPEISIFGLNAVRSWLGA